MRASPLPVDVASVLTYVRTRVVFVIDTTDFLLRGKPRDLVYLRHLYKNQRLQFLPGGQWHSATDMAGTAPFAHRVQLNKLCFVLCNPHILDPSRAGASELPSSLWMSLTGPSLAGHAGWGGGYRRYMPHVDKELPDRRLLRYLVGTICPLRTFGKAEPDRTAPHRPTASGSSLNRGRP